MFLPAFAALLLVTVSGIAGRCPKTTYRRQWNAHPPKHVVKMVGKPNKIIIKDTGHTHSKCSSNMMYKQRQDQHKSDDINCNFAFGFAGDVCEGRGWFNAVNDTKTLVFCVFGNFHHQKVDPKLNETISEFLNCPDSKVLLDPSYTISTPRDQSQFSENPGLSLYNMVRQMPRFKAGPYTGGINATDNIIDCPDLIERQDWSAKPATKVTPYTSKPTKILVKETGHRYRSCSRVIKSIQRKDMKLHKSDDIDCNFVFGQNGEMCEGRGWRNSVLGNDLLVLCVTDNSHSGALSTHLTNSLSDFFNCTLTDKLVDPNYQIITLRDTVPQSLNPGYGLYNFLTGLPRYMKSPETTDYNSLWKKEESVWDIGK